MSAPRVYLDHNSTAPLRPEVRTLLGELLDVPRGNPSSLHAEGRRARQLVDDARARVADALGVREEEVLFTSGATEANNLALLGALEALPAGTALITDRAEHPSVLAAADAAERAGAPVVRTEVDATGAPVIEQIVEAARGQGAAVVSVAAANGEVGALPDLDALGPALRALEHPPLLHVDAVQALGRVGLRLLDRGVDLASLSAHKVGGPAGVGILWRRRGVPLAPRAHGGGHEAGLRPGTEDAVSIAAAALAVELAVRDREAFAAHARDLVESLWSALAALPEPPVLVGPPLDEPRLANTLNARFPKTDGKVLVMSLDLEGLAVSAGSACASGSLEPSHVLRAMGLDDDDARGGLRFSVGRDTTHADCKRAVEIVAKTFSRRAQRVTSARRCEHDAKSSHNER
jgi:cysteine desulfurase